MQNEKITQIFSDADTTLFGAFQKAADCCGDLSALSYFGRHLTFNEVMADVEATARALAAAGVRQGDAVTFMLPNCPQAVSVFYAISRLGAVSNMIHTLSSEEEITYYLNKANSRCIVTADLFWEKAAAAAAASTLGASVICTSISECMPLPVRLGYLVKTRKTRPPKPAGEQVFSLRRLKKQSVSQQLDPVRFQPDRTASILYSGGSTGLPKGICLSNENINFLSIQISLAAGHRVCPGLKFLSAMPFFHGFGLGIGLHAIICNGAQCVLVPQFTLDSYIKTLLKEKTNMLAVVPSMLEAFLRSDAFDGRDLSFLKGVYCGADTIPPGLEEKVNAFLKAHGCREQVRAGYGLTECVTVCTLNPIEKVKIGSIGLPIGEMKCRVVKPDTTEDCPPGEAGELLVSGPTVMLSYLDEPEETAKTVLTDRDGRRWLRTGDLCRMDPEGYVYFIQRLKRLIITSGYNVYPAQVERVIADCPCVKACCVVGIRNKLLGQTVAAVAVLRDDAEEAVARREIMLSCKKRLAQYAVPSKLVFRRELPLTKMGKVDCVRLEKELNGEEGKSLC